MFPVYPTKLSAEFVPEHTDDEPVITPATGEVAAFTEPLKVNELIENVPDPLVDDQP